MNRISEKGSLMIMGKNEGLHTSGHAYSGELLTHAETCQSTNVEQNSPGLYRHLIPQSRLKRPYGSISVRHPIPSRHILLASTGDPHIIFYKKEAIQMVKLKPHKGITSLGFLCKEGIILASCSPLSTGTSNVMEIDRHMLSTMIGQPADKLFWKQCRSYESRKKQRMPVDIAAEIFAGLIDFYSEENWVGALIAGWEVHGPVLFCIDEEVGFTHCYSHAVGSGSSFADSIMGAGFQCHMLANEAASFARWAIRQAALLDQVADGVSTVYYVGPHGWELMAYDDVGNPGPYYPLSMNSVDEEMTEEDTQWSSYLELVESHRAIDKTLLLLCKS
ncbi:hypothetical protein K1719_020254 [Acacia pycnantha]|nr:hypothetical protein K1719_020254 [Acacia pycnantha]